MLLLTKISIIFASNTFLEEIQIEFYLPIFILSTHVSLPYTYALHIAEVYFIFILHFLFSQHRLFLGGRADVIRADHRADGRSAGPKLGSGRVARRDSVLPRDHAIRRHVRPDDPGVDLHDTGVRRRVQRRHRLGHHIDDTSRALRHVFR